MDLANHAAALNSSRGAAFGFAGIAKLAGEQLAPYVASMIPKLYRWGSRNVISLCVSRAHGAAVRGCAHPVNAGCSAASSVTCVRADFCC